MEIMLDLETMGTSPNSPIIAIGAVSFSKNIESEFYCQVNLDSCVKVGMEIDSSTVIWWLKQSESARKKFFDNDKAENLADALKAFTLWLGEQSVSGVWGCGANFDNVIIANAYEACGLTRPWPFWLDKCYRTVRDLRPEVNFVRKGDHHNALDDARSQAEHLIKLL